MLLVVFLHLKKYPTIGVFSLKTLHITLYLDTNFIYY